MKTVNLQYKFNWLLSIELFINFAYILYHTCTQGSSMKIDTLYNSKGVTFIRKMWKIRMPKKSYEEGPLSAHMYSV